MARGATTNYTEHEVWRIQAVLLTTWQSVIAISEHSGVDHKKTLAILKDRATDLRIERRDCRLDGHNPVWMVRRLPESNRTAKC